ncbi:hypothetical protein [Fibrobacter sp. UBA4297]|uniref:hypothetical protein n=1 Tax=Fibrobacter sp. UBA4297 TaxID=1946536 RepID=UPI0025BD9593|nr:hypothetical protein [Fibrobacter sp. UBA4297]
MKKITLSAAILAMTMMGCSDTGLDNSVASTNDVKQEKSHNSLAKLIDSQNKDFHRLLNMQPTDIHGNGFEYYAFVDAGIGIQFYTIDDLDYDGHEAQALFNIAQAPFNPNTLLVATGLFSDCDSYGYCIGFHNVGVAYNEYENISNVSIISNVSVQSPPNPEGDKLSRNKWYKEFGTISAFVAVWNQGTPDELVTNGAIYHGGMFEGPDGASKARAIYSRYIWPEIYESRLFKE